MNESIFLILHHVRMVWHHRWLALGCATLLCLTGWVTVMLIPNQYLVTAKVFLDTRSSLKPLLRGIAVDSNMRADTALMVRRTLLTRPNLEAVARKVDLDLKAKTPRAFDLLLQDMESRISVYSTDSDNIFVISYKSEDPRLAKRVVEALLNIFVERSLGESRKDSSTSKEFLDKQIQIFEHRLEVGENRLREFKQKNVGLMPGEGKTYFGQLEDMNSKIADAKLQLDEAQKRRDELKKQLTGEEPSFGIVPTPQAAQTSISTPLDGRIAALQKKLDDLRLQYTDAHPDVIATKQALDKLKKERESMLSKDASGNVAAPTPPEANPVYQDLKIALGQAEANVAALQARVAEYQRRQTDLKKLVNTVPKIEAEMQALNRNYSIDKRNYEELVKRREALNISQEAAQTSDDFQFNVIEPPRVPLVPVSPNRSTLSIGALVMGIAGGLGIAWLIALLRPTFYTSDGFLEITEFPVLGTVSRVWTKREAFHRRVALASFVAGFACLLGLYGSLMVLQATHSELLARLPELTSRIPELAGRLL